MAHRYEQQVTIAAPASKVFDYVSDMTKHGEWGEHGLQDDCFGVADNGRPDGPPFLRCRGDRARCRGPPEPPPQDRVPRGLPLLDQAEHLL